MPALVRAMESTGAGIWEWDIQTNRTLWSPAVWKLYGLTPGQHTPCYQSWADSIHPDDREAAQRKVAEAVSLAQPFEVEWRRHGDQTAWIMARGQPDHRPDGLHYIGIVLDITERKQTEQAICEHNQTLEERIAERTQALEDSTHMLQHILDGIPGLVGYWDQNQRNRFANRAYGEWFGQPPEAIKGRHLRELLGPSLYERNRGYIEATLRGEAQCFERDLTNVAGETRTTEAHYLPDVIDGEVRGFLVMVFDISQVKRAEQAAEAANQAKSEFLANISHELRTPLNAMFGMAQLGMHAHEGSPAARTFQQILQSGQHLMTLINDVLDFSRIEAGKMPIQQGDVDLGQLIEHVVTMSAGRAEAKGLMLRLSESPQLPRQFTGDATRCAQILLNLLGNAIKFTDQGMVQLDIDLCGDAPDTQLRFTVRDTGVGIPPEAAARLFRPFEQAHRDQNRDDGGTGLGLAISQRLARLMGGDIQFDSTLGEGSTFTLVLPASYQPPLLAPAP
ncbi:ATP-binding protein, partial [Aquabacterium sp.]|uniref:PAS domain-containing sensor histidine kinase n=1 Tax=Aquabacterium sp. TaxID=1872578 RepID=UPI0025C5B2BA